MSTTPTIRPGSPARVLPTVLRAQLARGGATLEAGRVLAVPDADHVTLDIGNQPVVVPRLGSYVPTVGEAAWCITGRSVLIALGAVGSVGGGGTVGPPGPAGTPGEVWYTGAGAPPAATGIVGDWWLDSATGDYYDKTGTSAWTLRGNLRGPTGPAGPAGPAGAGDAGWSFFLGV